jgi:hypothetical protein
MNNASDAVGTSEQKHRLYVRYAHGEIGVNDLAEGVARIRPVAASASRWMTLAGYILSVVMAFVLPHWAQQKKD